MRVDVDTEPASTQELGHIDLSAGGVCLSTANTSMCKESRARTVKPTCRWDGVKLAVSRQDLAFWSLVNTTKLVDWEISDCEQRHHVIS